MNVWLTIVAAGLLTYATRLSFIYLWGRMTVAVYASAALRACGGSVRAHRPGHDHPAWCGKPLLAQPATWAAAGNSRCTT
jgi:hypothetical protein